MCGRGRPSSLYAAFSFSCRQSGLPRCRCAGAASSSPGPPCRPPAPPVRCRSRLPGLRQLASGILEVFLSFLSLSLLPYDPFTPALASRIARATSGPSSLFLRGLYFTFTEKPYYGLSTAQMHNARKPLYRLGFGGWLCADTGHLRAGLSCAQ